jgi:hypothetical protein
MRQDNGTAIFQGKNGASAGQVNNGTAFLRQTSRRGPASRDVRRFVPTRPLSRSQGRAPGGDLAWRVRWTARGGLGARAQRRCPALCQPVSAMALILERDMSVQRIAALEFRMAAARLAARLAVRGLIGLVAGLRPPVRPWRRRRRTLKPGRAGVVRDEFARGASCAADRAPAGGGRRAPAKRRGELPPKARGASSRQKGAGAPASAALSRARTPNTPRAPGAPPGRRAARGLRNS